MASSAKTQIVAFTFWAIACLLVSVAIQGIRGQAGRESANELVQEVELLKGVEAINSGHLDSGQVGVQGALSSSGPASHRSARRSILSQGSF